MHFQFSNIFPSGGPAASLCVAKLFKTSLNKSNERIFKMGHREQQFLWPAKGYQRIFWHSIGDWNGQIDLVVMER
ncbi:MAG: hypothetical protein VR64_14635 [Desulfatitalea sp. BRH_c12]|nr:MAG: hypothetical protein VR64_14635 [Desulfatitalea sp. BRH_c12]